MSEQELYQIERFIQVAGTYAEAMTIPLAKTAELHNSFGRKVDLHANSGLSLLLGKAVSGLRCAAMLTAKQLQSELQNLAAFHRLHVPLSLVVQTGGQALLPQLMQTDCIVFHAYTAQEMADLLLSSQVISEKSMNPVVIMLSQEDPAEIELPSQKQLIHWFGNPDDRVAEPTKPQEMVMGAARRRMPAWLHIDQSVFVGVHKDHHMMVLEQAAQQLYDRKHYNRLIQETLNDFEVMSGRPLTSYHAQGSEKPKLLLLSTAVQSKSFQDKALSKTLKKKKAQLISLRQLHPMPDIPSKTVERMSVLEPISFTQQGQYFATCLLANHSSNIHFENGWFAEAPGSEGITAALDHLLLNEAHSNTYFLDVPLLNGSSHFPKHEVLLQQLKRDYPELESLQVRSTASPNTASLVSSEVPAMVKRYANQGPPYAKISRFYDSTFCLYQQNTEALIADPFQAYPVMPIATASFKDHHTDRDVLPVFQPKACKDIDELILSCPYGALPSGLITVESLLQYAEAQVRKAGGVITQLTPQMKKWVKAANSFLLKNKEEIALAHDFLEPSFEAVLAKGKWDDEKAALLNAESQLILKEVGAVPVVIDEHLFTTQERRAAGTGELFTLAVDPMACTACGNCAQVGDDACMRLKPQSEVLEHIKSAYNTFEQLPQTSEYSIERLIEDPDFDPFAALLLNKQLYRSLASSTENELLQPEAVIRYYLALQTYKMKPKLGAYVSDLDEVIASLKEGIKSLLSNSLPVNQLDDLMGVLSKHSENKLQMKRVFDEWGEETSFSSIDKNKLERKVQLLEEMKELRALLHSGISGFGRPACTVVLDQGLSSLANYPSNPFNVPVIASGPVDTAALALGVCAGQLRHVLDQFRVQRRATLEAAERYKPLSHDKKLAGLSWNELTDTERGIIPPVIVLVTKAWLLQVSTAQLDALLLNPYPVKLLVLDDGVIPSDKLLNELQSSSNRMWSLIAQSQTYVAQAALDDRGYLFEQMNNSLDRSGNAVIQVLAPNVAAFDIAASHGLQLSSLARSSRAFLQWHFDPALPLGAIASKISTAIEGIDQDFHWVQLEFIEEEKKQQMDYPMSWADWAYIQHEFKVAFTPVEKTEDAVFVRDYLSLDAKAREKAVPVIVRVNAEGKLQYYSMTDVVVRACELSVSKVRILREWAGLYTDFPEKLRTLVEQELRKEFESIQGQFEQQLNQEKMEWEANYLTKVKQKIKDKLLTMSGM